jgi:alcohol dehydrogenase (quinone), dehydrogenase subunit
MSPLDRTRRQACLVLAFGLAASAVASPVTAQGKPAAKASKVEYEGWRQYMANCARCHGDDAVAGAVAVDLREALATGSIELASFVSTVKQGRSAAGMPPFQKTLQDDQIAAIYAYVKARADKRLTAGRPTT